MTDEFFNNYMRSHHKNKNLVYILNDHFVCRKDGVVKEKMEFVFQVRDDDIHVTGRRLAYKRVVAVEKD